MNQPTATIDLPSTDQPYVLQRDEGPHYHFLNHLATTKVSGAESGSMSVVEFTAPKGFGPPLHEHDEDDEILIVLDGEIAFRSGDKESVGRSGAIAFLPHGVPHQFQVLSETARFLTVSSPSGTGSQFDRMVATLGSPLEEPIAPAPTEIDPGEVAEAGAACNITILGPPPEMI